MTWIKTPSSRPARLLTPFETGHMRHIALAKVVSWMKVAGMAGAFNLPVVSHVVPEMHLHLIAAVPNGLTVEYMPWMLKLYEETPAIEKGQLVLPTTPGLGLKFDEKAVAAYRVG
jgi:L-talarate/galactarate dehydratase